MINFTLAQEVQYDTVKGIVYNHICTSNSQVTLCTSDFFSASANFLLVPLAKELGCGGFPRPYLMHRTEYVQDLSKFISASGSRKLIDIMVTDEILEDFTCDYNIPSEMEGITVLNPGVEIKRLFVRKFTDRTDEEVMSLLEALAEEIKQDEDL